MYSISIGGKCLQRQNLPLWCRHRVCWFFRLVPVCTGRKCKAQLAICKPLYRYSCALVHRRLIQIKICAMPAERGHGTYKRGACRLKKLFCLILVFSIMLCGCTQQPNTTSKPSSQNDTASSPKQNLHMLHSSNEKAGKKAKTSDGIYFVELRNDDSRGINLLYLDYATLEQKLE